MIKITKAECLKQARNIKDCVKNPPFNWRICNIGAYVLDSKDVFFYVTYIGQGVPANVYNREYVKHVDIDSSFIWESKINDIATEFYSIAKDLVDSVE